MTLRQSTNLNGEPIFATLPVVDLTAAASTESIIFPQVGAGVGLSTQIALINPSEASMSGQIQLFDDAGDALELELDGTSGAVFPYQIPGNGIFRAELTNGSGTGVGYAVVTLEEGTQTPSGTAIFQFTSGNAVISEAGVAGVTSTTSARIFVDNVGTRTGVAIANPQSTAVTVTFDLLDSGGGALQQTTRDLPARGHLAIFADELFSQVTEGFTGLMEITAPLAIAPVTLKLTTNSRNQLIVTTLPLADLTRSVTAASLIFPQIGFGEFPGGEFATRLIFINPDRVAGAAGTLSFSDSDGNDLSVPLGQDTASEFPFLIPAGGGEQLRPGVMSGPIAQIVIDPANPTGTGVVVNVGNTLQLSPRALDATGTRVDNAAFTYSSLDAGIATVDAFGEVEGVEEGFSTLTVSSGAVQATATIAVVRVTAGSAGFEIMGVAQDLSSRLYLANTRDHTILLAQDLESTLERYAGTDGAAGLRDDQRLQSLFNSPTFLAFDQAEGNLYVSDRDNHVIRQVQSGETGEVLTLAGTGQPGMSDGSSAQAAFNNPQGIALDNRGNLWVVDTLNHTIRRISTRTGMVETIAGMAGVAGLVDGIGEEARFDSPMGIAVETESAGQRLERQRLGEPPPLLTMIVTDTGNGVIRRVRENGEVETIGVLGQGTSGERNALGLTVDPLIFNSPVGVAVDSFGNIYVTDPGSGEVMTILSSGEVVSAVQPDTFSSPQGIVITESGKVVVADTDVFAQQIVLGTPEITNLTPGAISTQGGAVVTIRGRSFAPDSLVVVAGEVITDVQIQDTQTITLVAPELPSGLTTVTVQHRGGIAQTSLFVEPFPFDQLPVGHLTTVAGGTTFTGDGFNATAAFLSSPAGIALDSDGNLFIADEVHGRVRRVDATTGIMTTVAGNGESGCAGNRGLATAGALAFPAGVVVDASGNLLIAARDCALIYKVDATTGLMTWAAGRRVEGFSGDGGPAPEATLNGPQAMALHSDGNLFISDRGNNRIRKVDVATGVITTVAGTGEAGFSGDGGPATEAALDFPRGIVLDRDGNLFITDSNNQRIRRVDATTGIITTVVGTGEFGFTEDGGPATEAAIAFPRGVILEGSGNLLFSGSNNRIRKVDAITGILTTVAGTGELRFSGDGGPATEASLTQSLGLLVDGIGNLFVSDTFNNRIRKVDVTTGIITTVAGTGEGGLVNDGSRATEASLNNPRGLLVDGDGNLLIGDSGNHRIRRVDTTTGIITTVAGTGTASFSGDGGLATEAALSPEGIIALGSNGNLFIADRANHRIRKVDSTTGIITTVAGSGLFGPGSGSFSGDGIPATEATLNGPTAVVLDADGNLFIVDRDNNRIRRVDATTGIIMTVAGTGEPGFFGDGGPAIEAGLDPFRVTLDGDGNLLIGDSGNHRIRRVDAATGIITTVADTGEAGFSGDGGPATEADLWGPFGVSVDVEGNLFIADRDNSRIRRVDATTGIITTAAGNGKFGFTGDGGLALEAEFFGLTDVAIDEAGDLYIVDEGNQRIRAVRGIAQPVASPGVGPLPPMPVLNLSPYQPSGWSAPIVVSTTADTNTDSEFLSSTDRLFIDYAYINEGPEPTNVRFHLALLVDGEEVLTSFFNPPLDSGFFGRREDFELDPLSVGTHTVTLVVDSTSLTAESDESDNTFTKTIVISDEPPGVTISVTNHLLYPVDIEANGAVVGSVSAGQTMTSSLGVLSSLALSWDLNRPTVDGRPIGDAMGGSYSTIDDPSGTIPFTIDNVVGDTTYFVPLIDNETSDGLLMGVNMGLASENRCDCVVPASGQNVGFGYYRLFSNSNVRGYRTGSNYTGPYIFWGHDATVSPDGNLESLVESESGATNLQATTAP